MAIACIAGLVENSEKRNVIPTRARIPHLRMFKVHRRSQIGAHIGYAPATDMRRRID